MGPDYHGESEELYWTGSGEPDYSSHPEYCADKEVGYEIQTEEEKIEIRKSEKQMIESLIKDRKNQEKEKRKLKSIKRKEAIN